MNFAMETIYDATTLSRRFGHVARATGTLNHPMASLRCVLAGCSLTSRLNSSLGYDWSSAIARREKPPKLTACEMSILFHLKGMSEFVL